MIQCEKCDLELAAEDAEQQPAGQYQCEDGVTRTFCCDDCFVESEEDYRIGRMEARREYAVYGDDLDSWFR